MRAMIASVLSPPEPREASAQDLEEDAPRESVTRLIVGRRDALRTDSDAAPPRTEARPTTPVPSFYMLLPVRPDDELLAGRLEGLGEDSLDLCLGPSLDDPANDLLAASGDDEDDDPFDQVTHTRTVAPPRVEGTGPTAVGCSIFSLLASPSRVPYLRRDPRHIPPGSVDHSQAVVLALIDGHTSIAQLIEVSPLPPPRVLEVVGDLLSTGVIGLHG